VIDEPPGSDFFTQLGVSESLRAIIARSAKEFESTGDWVTFDTLAYEAAEQGISANLNEIFALPSAIGGAWADEKVSLTGLGLLVAGTAPNTAQTLARLAGICAERKLRLRNDALIGRAILASEYGFTDEEAIRARDLIQMIPGVLGGGNLGDDWSLSVYRTALDYRDVETVDDLRALLETKGLEHLRQQHATMAVPLPFNLGDVFKNEPNGLAESVPVNSVDVLNEDPIQAALDERRLRYFKPDAYLAKHLGEENVERLVTAIDSGLDPLMLAVASRWSQLESYLRQLLYIALRSMFGGGWESQLGLLTTKRASSVSRLGYMASTDDDHPVAHLDVKHLFELIELHWTECQHGIGISQTTWRGRVEELNAIRNRMAHGRRPHRDDVLRIEQTLRDLESSARGTLQSYVTFADLDPSLDDPLVDAWLNGKHSQAHLVQHGSENKGIYFNLQYSVLPWAVSRLPLSGTQGMFWSIQVVCVDRYLDIAAFSSDSAVTVSTPWIGHVLSPSPNLLLITFPMVDDPGEVADAIGRCFEAVFNSAKPGREPSERAWLDRRERSYDGRIDVEGMLSVLSGVNPTDPIKLFSA